MGYSGDDVSGPEVRVRWGWLRVEKGWSRDGWLSIAVVFGTGPIPAQSMASSSSHICRTSWAIAEAGAGTETDGKPPLVSNIIYLTSRI